MTFPGGRVVPRLDLRAITDQSLTPSWALGAGLPKNILSPQSQKLLEDRSTLLRAFDRWVEAVDKGKLEIRLEALELRNTRLEEELERERDRRVTDAVERDERQIALGRAIAERLFELRAVTLGAAFAWFAECTRGGSRSGDEGDGAEQAAAFRKAAESRQREFARRVVTRIMRAELARAFQGWSDGAEWQRNGRGACLRVLERMRQRTVARTFGTGWAAGEHPGDLPERRGRRGRHRVSRAQTVGHAAKRGCGLF